MLIIRFHADYLKNKTWFKLIIISCPGELSRLDPFIVLPARYAVLLKNLASGLSFLKPVSLYILAALNAHKNVYLGRESILVVKPIKI